MRKKVTAAAAVLAAVLLAGCAGQGQQDAAESSSAAASSVSEASEAAEAVSGSSETADMSAAYSDYYVEITDDLGRTVEFTKMPEKVAVLNGSYAETWILAGGEISAVVKDAWEDYDLGLSEDVVNLGSTKDLNIELIFDTEPDLILASAGSTSHKEARETFENAKVPVLYFEVNNFNDYLRMLDACTQITGRADLYETNGTAIQAQVDEVKAAAEAAIAENGAPKVLLIRAAASGVHAKGSTGTVAGEMLADLGVINIADGSDLLEDLSLEKIIEEDPDFIFIVQQGDDTEGMQKLLDETLMNNPAWAGLTAVKEGRLYYLEKNLYHFKPNNKWGTAYEKLEKLLFEA